MIPLEGQSIPSRASFCPSPLAGFRCLLPLILISIAAPADPDSLVLGDFENGNWPGLVQSRDPVKEGKFSARWANLVSNPTLRFPDIPRDWSGYDRLVFWLHSSRANGQRLTLVCDSDNPADKAGWDYYYLHFTVDWEGWRRFDLRLGTDIRPTRRPVGWHRINQVTINSAGWQHRPLPDTLLHIDGVRLVRAPLRIAARARAAEIDEAGALRAAWLLTLTNRGDVQRSVRLRVTEADSEKAAPVFRIQGLPEQPIVLSPQGEMNMEIALVASAERLGSLPPLSREEFVIEADSGVPGALVVQTRIAATRPLPAREHPFLFGDAALFRQALDRAARLPWAKRQVDKIKRAAEAILEAELSVPEGPGQWSHHYVCKKCGTGLRFDPPGHVCKRCGTVYTGWPYDQVVDGRIHGRNWRDVRTLGLAYAFTGNEAYAERARGNLLAYADRYADWPLHNVRGNVSNSAGRMLAQTLDEAVSVIGLAWGYDLIYTSPCFTGTDRDRIENRLFREVVKTIRRNSAGISNWQSWHNAGIAAVGFCLQDAEIASQALYGRHGLAYQLENSILEDGFWYEGTAAYHYYALDALRWTVEAAHFAAIDFSANRSYRSLFDAPLDYVFPDLRFPAVNDSDVFSLTGRHALYELAYARWADPAYLAVARHGKRSSLEALLWGVEALPTAPLPALESRVFRGLGSAVLRQGRGPDALYAHLDYGPHGGGHGHQDKLALILFGLGRQLAPDPGRLAYGAPLQGSWYRTTFAHNTLCVDEKSQRATTGQLLLFHSRPGLAVARARSAGAYPGVRLQRTLALTPGYLVDVFEAESDEEHTYDWLYHNFGDLRPGMETRPRERPLSGEHGYRHLEDIAEATVEGPWHADFVGDGANVRLTLAASDRTALFFGMGMANNPPRPCPMVVVRRRGKSTRFVSVIEPYRDRPAVTSLECREVEGGGVLLRMARGAATDWLLLADGSGREFEVAGVTTRAAVCLVQTKAGTPHIVLEAR